jgi:LPS-assembly lipoprotein
MRMRAANLLVLAVFAGLAACGFQLQGRHTLPATLAAVYLEPKDAQSDFTQALRAQLVVSGARVMPAAVSDAATVTVLRDEVTERVLSVSVRNIPTDYELSYEVEVSVSAGGRELMAREPFSLSRVYSFDQTNLLAKEREKEILIRALARDMASVVVRRLGAL